MLQVRIDKKMKQLAQKNFARMGLTLSSGVKLCLMQVNNAPPAQLPFLTAENFSPARKKRLLAEAKDALKRGKSYATIQEAHRDILR